MFVLLSRKINKTNCLSFLCKYRKEKKSLDQFKQRTSFHLIQGRFLILEFFNEYSPRSYRSLFLLSNTPTYRMLFFPTSSYERVLTLIIYLFVCSSEKKSYKGNESNVRMHLCFFFLFNTNCQEYWNKKNRYNAFDRLLLLIK